MVNVILRIDKHHEIVIATFLFRYDADEWVKACSLDNVYVQDGGQIS